MKKDLLLNKDTYSIKYFITDFTLFNYLSAEKIQLIKIGTSRRLKVLFKTKNIKSYMFLKKKCELEQSFLNITLEDGMYCANFIADKKFNITLDMIIKSNTIDCISNTRILETLKLL